MTVRWRWSALQWGILILAAPVLLFPSLSPEATLLMLLLLSGSWVAASIRRCPWPVTPFNGALLLFATMVGVGIITSAYPGLTLPKATGLILGMGLFRAVAGIPGRDGCTLALAGFLLIATGVWGIGLLGTAWSLKVPALQAWLDRLPAEILTVPEAPEQGINPNQLGGALSCILPVPVALAMRGRVTWRSLPLRLLGGVLAVVWGGTLILTQSRSGWIGGMMGLAALAVLAAVSGRCRWIRLLGVNLSLLTFAAVVATTLYVGPQQGGEILYGIEGDTPIRTVVGSFTIAGRMDIWNRARYVIWDFPVTGCGLGTFRQVMRDFYPLSLAPPGLDIAHAHNMFLQVTLDLGLPGLVAYLALLGLAGMICWQVAWQGREARWLALGLMAGLIGLHVYGLTDALALGYKPGLEFWLALGIVAGLAQMDGDKTGCTQADAGAGA